MAKGAEIKKVIINFPEDVTKEEVEQRACAAYAKIICEMYPQQIIEKIIQGLEKQK